MNTITNLQRENKQLKEYLQDAVALAAKYKREMGNTDQEELARLSAPVSGIKFNPLDFDLTCKNGEQGR